MAQPIDASQFAVQKPNDDDDDLLSLTKTTTMTRTKSGRQKKPSKEELPSELAELIAEDDANEPQEPSEMASFRHGNIRQRERHGMKYSMYCVRFSPDGRSVVTTSADKSARIWSLKTGKETANFEHFEYVRCAVFSPDGTRLCTGCDDRIARVWHVTDSKTVTPEGAQERMVKHRDWIVCACFSSDGILLCTVSRDQAVHITDLREEPVDPRKHVDKPEGEDGDYDPGYRKVHIEQQTFAACFSLDNEVLVTASGWENGKATVFDVQSLDQLLVIDHKDWVYSAVFSPFGGAAHKPRVLLTTSKDKRVRVWELPEEMLSGAELQADKDAKAKAEEERKAAEAGKKKLVISRKKQQEMAEQAERDAMAVAIHATMVTDFKNENYALCACWSPDGKLVCIGGETGCVRIVQVEPYIHRGRELIRFEHQEPIMYVNFSPSGRKVCSSSLDGVARVYGGLRKLWEEKPKLQDAGNVGNRGNTKYGGDSD